MLVDFAKNIIVHNLFGEDQKILLAVSGGIDSMVLLHLFHESGYKFGVVHCNFNLRGDESDNDEKFVMDYIQSHGIEYYFESFDTEEYAKINGVSIEMAARELRYTFFERIRSENNFDFIATAHHQDDVIETFFINLVRKTGIKGLTGIKPKMGKIIRPLLFASRKEIEKYAAEEEINFREDSSNHLLVFKRNFIRHEILPKFDELSASSRANILASIGHLKEVEQVYRDVIESEKKNVVFEKESSVEVSISNLLKSKHSKVLLFEILYGFHFNATVVREVFDSLKEETSGKVFYSSDYRLVKDRKKLILEQLGKKGTGNFYVEKEDEEIIEPLELIIRKIPVEGFKIPASERIACLDYDKLDFPLIVKKWQKGEYFQPLGMSGFKKVSDFFIDAKMSIPEKENTSILYSGDKIVWIIGKRIDNRFKITKETSTVYQIELVQKKMSDPPTRT